MIYHVRKYGTNSLRRNKNLDRLILKHLTTGKGEFEENASRLLLELIGWQSSMAPVPVELIARRLGVAISLHTFGNRDGLLQATEVGYKILVNSDQLLNVSGHKYFSSRGRFTVAHELAHFLLRYIAAHFEVVGRMNNVAIDLDNQSVEETASIEVACNRIAGSVLVTEQVIGHLLIEQYRKKNVQVSNVFPTLKYICEVLQELEVSPEVFMRRLNKSQFLDFLQKLVILCRGNQDRQLNRLRNAEIVCIACPNWGFIPIRQSLQKIGISSLIEDFPLNTRNVTYQNVNLNVMRRTLTDAEISTRNWKRCHLETLCEVMMIPSWGARSTILICAELPRIHMTQKE